MLQKPKHPFKKPHAVKLLELTVQVGIVSTLGTLRSDLIYNLYLLSFILMLNRAPVDTSPVTEGVTLFNPLTPVPPVTARDEPWPFFHF